MMRGMISCVSGLRVHQAKMDVIGNNIANVNTVGFKSSRVNFQEVFSQTIKNATSADASSGKGGSNPMQVGLGLSISSIDNVQTRGSMERTDNPTDLAINGEGFFIVKEGVGKDYKFTRAGNFGVDKLGNIVTADGLNVYGWQNKKLTDDTVFDTDSDIQAINIYSGKETIAAKETTKAVLEGNLNSKCKSINELTVTEGWDPSDPDSTPSNPLDPTTPLPSNPLKPGYFVLPLGYEKNASNDGLIPKVGGENMKTIMEKKGKTESFMVPYTSYDKLGNATTVNITFVKNQNTTDAISKNPQSEWFWYAVDSNTQKGIDNYNYNNQDPKPADQRTDPDPIDPTTRTPDQGIVLFDSKGKMVGASPVGGATSGNFDVTISEMPDNPGTTYDAVTINLKNLTMYNGEGSVKATDVDGCPSGKLTNFVIGEDGTITGTYSNGQQSALGIIGLAFFKNPAGLEKVGSNLFTPATNSGDFTKAIKPGEQGAGSLSAGMLEMSNVDLSKEFIDMITTQRGFQANSKIISTTDEMLQDLVNLKRS